MFFFLFSFFLFLPRSFSVGSLVVLGGLSGLILSEKTCFAESSAESGFVESAQNSDIENITREKNWIYLNSFVFLDLQKKRHFLKWPIQQ
jgi:hypothetical protein